MRPVQSFFGKRTGTGFALLSSMLLSVLLLAACGDKADIKNPQISLQPGATWQFQGQVETIDNPWWVVEKQRILVDQTTVIDTNPSPKVGSQVRIEGQTKDGGVLEASSIKVVVIIGVPTVTPSGTLTAGPTQTVAASPSVASTGTPETTATVETTVTPGSTATATVAATVTPAPTSTAVPPTATAVPAGTTIEIVGVIQQVVINNNQTIIIIDNRQYILSPAILAVIKPRLVVGVPINFVARYDPGNLLVIINVTKINNQVIMVNNNPVVVTGAGEDDQGDKAHKSNGNCEGHSNGNCQGDKNKGNDDKGKDKGGKPRK
jgi:hypothetical protein